MTQRFDIQYKGVMLLNPDEKDKHWQVQSEEEEEWESVGAGRGVFTGHHLVRLVEKQAEVGEDHPELLPAVTVLELPQ